MFDPAGILGGSAGTISAGGAWAEDTIVSPSAGWWRIVLCTSGENRFSLEARAGDELLPVLFEPPAELLWP
jgi:hypothetical protein